mmetsp:Transcript_11390/g.25845  ORF Transcript_11390/g.25845 Transcript_11390/m.25845 type:complete len:90 (-) Transcript_11390:102-371(-)
MPIAHPDSDACLMLLFVERALCTHEALVDEFMHYVADRVCACFAVSVWRQQLRVRRSGASILWACMCFVQCGYRKYCLSGQCGSLRLRA